jgi:tripartite-type tricarboxylate transporter receptor subunit TctC
MPALRLMLLLLACAFATGASAVYPDKPIRLIVPQAAGSATDTVARILGAELGKEFGQQIVIDNRPGGALTIGLDLTAKAEPDGYTICMGPIGALAITRHMVAKLPYDIERDFQPIALRPADICYSRSRPRCRSSRCRKSSTTPRAIRASS